MGMAHNCLIGSQSLHLNRIVFRDTNDLKSSMNSDFAGLDGSVLLPKEIDLPIYESWQDRENQ